MFGKKKCKILKEIRRKIAEENDIPYITHGCTHQGECSGTCPRCEQELRELEHALQKRQRLGKAVAVTAVAAGISLSMAGCVEPRQEDQRSGEVEASVSVTSETVTVELLGEYTELDFQRGGDDAAESDAP